MGATGGGTPEVLWREGMFLCPQHLQAFARELYGRIGHGESLGRLAAWGVVSLDIATDELARDVMKVNGGEFLFQDGSLAILPGNATIAQREFRSEFRGPTLDVWIGLPSQRPGTALVSSEPDGARYRSRFVEFQDENTADDSRELEVREYQLRLFFGDEDRTGHECIPLARLIRAGRPEPRSCLSDEYVVPVVRLGASAGLRRRLGDVAAAARETARDLATRVPANEILKSGDRDFDVAAFLKLQAVNQCLPVLEQLAGIADLSPADAYLALVRMVGELSLFSPGRVPGELPAYEHERSHECFAAVLPALATLLGTEVTDPYDVAHFQGDPSLGMLRCELPEDWVQASYQPWVAVEVSGEPDEVEPWVKAGAKLLAERDLERVLGEVVPGIPLVRERTPPLAFPKRAGLHYFRIDREGEARPQWLKIQEDRIAALLLTRPELSSAKFHLYAEIPVRTR